MASWRASGGHRESLQARPLITKTFSQQQKADISQRAWGEISVSVVVEHLPSMHKVLCSTTSITKNYINMCSNYIKFKY